MRFAFPNLTRPKKAAKSISQELRIALSTTQQGMARTMGYVDWYDFEKNHTKGDVFQLDESLSNSDFIARQVSLSLSLSRELNIADGDAQHALSFARLTGDRPTSLFEQISIRVECWRLTSLPPAEKRKPGAIGKLNATGYRNQPVILQSYNRPSKVITHKSIVTVADYEYVSPREPLSLFVPLRLYLPYGYWLEETGAKVLFSRDYKPLWRIVSGARAERLNPWDWITWKDQQWFWEDSNTPWASEHTKLNLENLLRDNNIQTLPILADALPLIVHNKAIDNFSRSVEPLRLARLGMLEVA